MTVACRDHKVVVLSIGLYCSFQLDAVDNLNWYDIPEVVAVCAWHWVVRSLHVHIPVHILSVDSIHKLQPDLECLTAMTMVAHHTVGCCVVVLILVVVLPDCKLQYRI